MVVIAPGESEWGGTEVDRGTGGRFCGAGGRTMKVRRPG